MLTRNVYHIGPLSDIVDEVDVPCCIFSPHSPLPILDHALGPNCVSTAYGTKSGLSPVLSVTLVI